MYDCCVFLYISAVVEKTEVNDRGSTGTDSLSESDSSVTDPTRFQKLHRRAINHMNQVKYVRGVSFVLQSCDAVG